MDDGIDVCLSASMVWWGGWIDDAANSSSLMPFLRRCCDRSFNTSRYYFPIPSQALSIDYYLMIIMPASGGRVASAIDQADADAARSKLIGWVNVSKPEYLHATFDEPFTNIPLEVMVLLREYLKVRL